jgi:hypothetical protein
MLHELYLEYDDGRIETKIIHTKEGERITISPQSDGIKFANHKPFKYHLPKHNALTKAIVTLGDKRIIMPHGIECHPKTTIDDIIIVEKRVNKPREEKPMVWNFKSSDGKGKYQVRQDMGKLKCNCMGFWKSKDKNIGCKHCQEVRALMLDV